MSYRTKQVKHLLPLILATVLLLGSAGCGSQSAPKSAEAAIEPQPGEWMAAFSVNLAGGKTENWKVYFDVGEDGKTVPTVQVIHYIGDQTPQSVFLLRKDSSINNNSFDFSITEYVSYSAYDYEGSATFISSKEAAGTINIYGDDYQFTAVPSQ